LSVLVFPNVFLGVHSQNCQEIRNQLGPL